MQKLPKSKSQRKRSLGLAELATRYRKVLYFSIVISLGFHILSFNQLQRVSDWYQMRQDLQRAVPSEPLRITVVDPSETDPARDTQSTPRRILEVHQEETEPPEVASHLGHQNHATEREMRLPESEARARGQEPGQAGDPNLASESVVAAPIDPLPEAVPPQIEPSIQITSPTGSVRLPKEQESSEYAALMPRREELLRQFQAGYQDYVDESVEVGDRIDINTSEYRFVGYFSLMRRAIEMVWSYPMEAARRGIQGKVHLEFTILKDGSTNRVRVIESSGYRVLDDAIVNAIRSAAPFAPLPESIDKDHITITGTFHYTLSRSFAGAH